MKDAIFVSHLIRLLPGNLKAEVEAKPTPADAAAWFLDKGIKPAVESADNEPFIFLLSVMEKFGLKNLCASIKAEILLLVRDVLIILGLHQFWYLYQYQANVIIF